MSWLQKSKLLWKLGDLEAETGANLVGWTCNGQRWFDAVTTPTTAGQVLTDGNVPINAWFSIDTHGCDMLAISFAAKITAVGTETNTTASNLRAMAFGTPFFNPKNIPAWRLPFSARANNSPTVAAWNHNNDNLYIFPSTNMQAGAIDTVTSEIVAQNAFMQLGAAPRTPVAGDYLRWHYWIGRRQRFDLTPSASTVSNLAFTPEVRGYSNISVAMVVVNAGTAGGGDTISMAAEMYAHRIYYSNDIPKLDGESL